MKLKTNSCRVVENKGQYAFYSLLELHQVDELKKLCNKDVDKVIEIKQYREKRSHDANSYAFKLMSEIAKVLTSTTEEVYIKMLEKYGVHDYCGVIPETIPTLKKAFKFVEVKGKININGVDGVRVKCTLGSSQYDSLQMSQFIEGIKTDCDDLGIETKTPDEIKQMANSWEGQ